MQQIMCNLMSQREPLARMRMLAINLYSKPRSALRRPYNHSRKIAVHVVSNMHNQAKSVGHAFQINRGSVKEFTSDFKRRL